MAYGKALRQRVLRFYDEGETTAAVADRLAVSRSWCRRVRQYRDPPPAVRRGRSFKLDESACPRLRQRVPAGHGSTELAEVWKRLTILGAIGVGGLVAAATVDAATDADVFRSFVNDCLVPALRPGMVVVMDNLSAHKVSGVREGLEAAGCRVAYLPPYSPDFSPIEPVWSKAKSVIRTLEARTVEDLEAAVTLSLEQVTAADCRNCFRDCGCTLHLK